jgi:hypothetical protein
MQIVYIIKYNYQNQHRRYCKKGLFFLTVPIAGSTRKILPGAKQL